MLFAETANEDLSCQWYHNGKAIEGATKMTYTIPKPSASDEGSYSVKLTNVSGIETTTDIVNIVKVVGAVPEVPPQGSDVPGDTNCDGIVELSDAILIMQALANPNKYGIDGSDLNHLTNRDASTVTLKAERTDLPPMTLWRYRESFSD